MSRFKARRAKEKLRKIFRINDPVHFFQLIWSVDAIATNRLDVARRFLNFPNEATNQEVTSRFYIHRWKLETLLNEYLTVPLKKSRFKTPRKGEWGAFSELYNQLMALEDEESLLDVIPEKIAEALPREIWRQFPWQQGFSESHHLYRSWSLYNSPAADAVLIKKVGLDFNEISHIGYLLYAQFGLTPLISSDIDLTIHGISNKSRDLFFSMTALPIQRMRIETAKKRRGLKPAAYKPSILRNFPIAQFEIQERSYFRCPIPDLLLQRITGGLFYDIVADDRARNMAAKAFEKYVIEITKFYFQPQSLIDEEFSYRNNGMKDSPDMIVCNQENQIQIVVECKTLNLNLNIRQSANPWNDHPEAFQQLIKGVLQVWRFCHQVHLKKFPKYQQSLINSVGTILTLHPWMEVVAEATREVIACAKDLATHEEIPEDAQIPISFVASFDWEASLQKLHPQAFHEALHIHSKEEKYGHMLTGIAKTISNEKPHARSERQFPYTNSISNVAPWFSQYSENPKEN